MTPDDLVEIEAIKQVKYRYFRFLDLKMWDEIEELFVPEATCAYSAGAYSFEGRDAIVGFFRKSMGRETFEGVRARAVRAGGLRDEQLLNLVPHLEIEKPEVPVLDLLDGFDLHQIFGGHE